MLSIFNAEQRADFEAFDHTEGMALHTAIHAIVCELQDNACTVTQDVRAALLVLAARMPVMINKENELSFYAPVGSDCYAAFHIDHMPNKDCRFETCSTSDWLKFL